MFLFRLDHRWFSIRKRNYSSEFQGDDVKHEQCFCFSRNFTDLLFRLNRRVMPATSLPLTLHSFRSMVPVARPLTNFLRDGCSNANFTMVRA